MHQVAANSVFTLQTGFYEILRVVAVTYQDLIPPKDSHPDREPTLAVSGHSRAFLPISQFTQIRIFPFG
jgi:hypothetical protein